MIFNNIKKICDEKGISISQLEKEAGLGNGTISGWKESMPRIDKLQAVAKVLNTEVNKLIE
ncbi:MAG: helix-turn-helix transcriptional regulator [Lachnospiraceae bacterium]|nr:helix-turn-helix transcriptional regulator [Lachnospiraceae bacterium]